MIVPSYRGTQTIPATHAVVTVAIMLLSTYVYARSVLMWLATPVNTGTKSAS